MMKLILPFLIVTVSLSSAFAYYLKMEDFDNELVSLAKKWHDMCIPITGATQKMIDDMRIGIFPEDQRIQRYTFCLWMISDMMSPEDFSLNQVKLAGLLPKKIKDGANIYKRCEKEGRESGKTEGYEMIWEMMKCIQKANPDTFVMF